MSTQADEMNFNRRLAAQIRTARIDKGWSQKLLAEILGTKQQVVSGWETGKHQPTPHQIGKLCKHLSRSADFFINDE